MLLNIVIFSTALLSSAFAQSTTSSSSTATSTSTAAIQTHTIAVGAVRGLPIKARLFHDPNADHVLSTRMDSITFHSKLTPTSAM
jgi:hypothetical protein